MSDIDCRALEDLVLDYLDGLLPVRRRRVAQAHLRECPACRAYLEAYRRTIDLVRAALAEGADVPPAVPEVPEHLIAAVLAARAAAERS